MTLEFGYKRTELGLIPVDWEVKSIHEFATIKTGPFGTLLKASEYSKGDGVPLISVGEIREGFLRITDLTPRISETVTRRLPQYVLRSGDIVFGRKGGVERSALIRQPQEGWFLGSDGISIRPVQKCHNEYLALQFQSARVQRWLLQNAVGTTMPSLNQEILGNVVIPLPSLPEQKAIAEALSDVDALITSLDKLLSKKRDIKQGVTQQLLTGKTRLPGFDESGGKFKQTEVGLIPEDWGVQALGALSLLQRGKFGARPRNDPRFFGGVYPFIQTGDVTNSNGQITSYSQTLNELGLGVSRLFPEQTLFFTIAANIGDVAFTSFAAACPDSLVAITPYSHVDKKWLYHELKSHKKKFERIATQNAQLNINLEKLNPYLLPCPPLSEQNAIARVLSDMDAEITALEARRDKTRLLKQGMMQELLTGRTRLAVTKQTRYLTHEEIQELHNTILQADLIGQRDVLLDGLPKGFVASLPYSSSPSADFLQTLHELNSIKRVKNHSLPLLSLLKNLKQAETDQATVFERFITLIKAPKVAGPTPIATPKAQELDHITPITIPTTALAEHPLHITNISLENIRLFEKLDIAFPSPTPNKGQWIILLGNNGNGKSTLLRAITLAIQDEQLSNALLELQEAPFIRFKCESGSLSIKALFGEYAPETSKNILVNKKQESIHKRGYSKLEFEQFPVFAYGCRRGSALGGSDRDLDFKPISSVLTLFDEGSSLLHAETWLKQLKLESIESEEGASRFDTITQTLSALLPGVEKLNVLSSGVWISGAEFGLEPVPLSALSDGYLTTTGWLLDMFARWLQYAEECNIFVEKDFNLKMNGLVILDELDLHLHPRWQTHVISDLKQLFPMMSFITTTHNPLTLLGAEAGEIHIITKDSSGKITIKQRDLPPGKRTEQVLTGEWFGLLSTLDKDTLSKLEQHRQMLRKKVPRDDKARIELERELRHRLSYFGDTPSDMTHLETTAEFQEKPFTELTQEERSHLQEKVQAHIKNRLQKGKS